MSDVKTIFEHDKNFMFIFWDFRNNFISPYTLKVNSSIKVYWRCVNHNKPFLMSPFDVFKRNRWCSYCKSILLLKGFNDLQSFAPYIADIWDYEKNSLLPSDLMKSSHTSIWVRCDKKPHSYQTSPMRLTTSPNRKCPICAGKIADFTNNITNNRPKAAECWDYQKNTLTPDEVTFGSNKKIFFIGKYCGHSFQKIIKLIKEDQYPACTFCAYNNAKVLTGHNDLETLYPELIEEWDFSKNNEDPQKIVSGSNSKYHWICKNDTDHEWEAKLGNRTRVKSGCPKCSNRISKGEQELSEFIEKELNIEVIKNSRNIIKPFELDIYIPKQKIAIEFNGVYWHSEAKKINKNYHHDKWLMCKNKGIQLIQIWQDDWVNNRTIIKTMLSHKLSSSSQEKIFARKTSSNEIRFEESNKEIIRTFYETNHIQGFVSAKHHFALMYNNTPVAMMSFKKLSDGVYELVRYATSFSVPGGFSKLLHSFEQRYKPTTIKSFSDNCISDGSVYLKNGFVKDGELYPDYKYLFEENRVHKFNFRLKRFKSDNNLKYIDGMSEKDLARLNNIPRVWDAGKIRWIKAIL